ncbi:DNA-binding MarR family transcriptional regulator [Nocardioides albertanoniae]|uniref:DNA-binding MarR family transcriptional regulator n=1 Tax=Nocardioides albertanoniae TaxID=1175486 RepID=A0A543A8U4_9ACTN|nr:MarR family transcriptional regulator [Nocardioides albertanoniae]TQL69017.1 DNA-binding MarR family transcriptional regulator [Nocardioides albertanoniae]
MPVHESEVVPADRQWAGEQIEREMLILMRHQEMSSPRRLGGAEALDRSAYVLLNRIEAQGPMSVVDLVDAFGLAASTFNRQTATLLKHGLVERTLDPDGGIARKFRITDKGRERVKADRDIVVEGLSKVIAEWAPERVERFVDDLRQFNQDIERLTGRHWPR